MRLACRLVLAATLLSACKESLRAPERPLLMTYEGCLLTPGCGGGADGSVVSTGIEPALEYPPDPSPNADGVWIGFGATDCYVNHGAANAIDVDGDWLRDDCEYRLAREFAPLLQMSVSDGCSNGEPYWAATYFDDPYGIGWGQFVRIAYMLGYYRDCGDLDGHQGDSEFIMIQVGYNGATQHWEMMKGYLSAHSGSFFAASVTFKSYAAFEFTGPNRAYPRVWVSRNKHANYPSHSSCENGGVGMPLVGGTDVCPDNFPAGRLRVWESHNVGGRNFAWVGCTISQNSDLAWNDRDECFWSRIRFTGWQVAPRSSGADPYFDYLMSGAYECWLYDGFNCYYGP